MGVQKFLDPKFEGRPKFALWCLFTEGIDTRNRLNLRILKRKKNVCRPPNNYGFFALCDAPMGIFSHSGSYKLILALLPYLSMAYIWTKLANFDHFGPNMVKNDKKMLQNGVNLLEKGCRDVIMTLFYEFFVGSVGFNMSASLRPYLLARDFFFWAKLGGFDPPMGVMARKKAFL